MPADQLSPAGTPAAGPDAVPQDGDWWQLYLHFTDWAEAENVAASHLAPLLHQAEADNTVTGWWYIRKHPCWRVRVRIRAQEHSVKARVSAVLDGLTAAGHLDRWWTGIYEPETAAFGNTIGMSLAHALFHADSRAILDLHHRGETALGRRELSILLCTTMMRAAALEWYEQGDVWHHVAQERPLPADVPPDRLQALTADLRQIMAADTAPDGPLLGPDGPVAFAADWADAFRRTGRDLAATARNGSLDRGLRQVLAYHVIFHWNRLGLPARTQSILSWAARAYILGPAAQPARSAIPHQTRPQSPAPTSADRIARRFPLVYRPHLTCPDLPTRVAQVRRHADAGQHQPDPEAAIDRACAAWNLAALIAADCGMPGLAADLCTRQFRVFHAAWPVAGRTAIASLQPLANLARLTHRAGDPEGAFQTLHALDHAVHHGGSTVIHGIPISFDRFTATGTDRKEVSAWLRTLLLDDGTRFLAAAGQWTRAAAHAAMHDDHAERLHEARQTQVITQLQQGRADSALETLKTATRTEPWEQAVAACLRTYHDALNHHLTTDGAAATLNAIQQAHRSLAPSGMLFSIRLALIAADLTAEHAPQQAQTLRTNLIQAAADSQDAYAAREVLHHPNVSKQADPATTQALRTLLDNAGLEQGHMPTPLLTDLMASLDTAEPALTRALSARTSE
ncbi:MULTISPECIES: thiopeptide-type bacteriocin biosynthesis protein [Streptomycetaceae]|nr:MULTISPECIES: thiopeptide-type bacteriocin biosynthesis protein [Streptomycetaceae]CCB73272.1 conserved protein of unknown function [Streptantibioticus cattleyicolor NRRL 8057 = DSM 46488]